ncbi:MAG: hypothetical protein Q7Q73_02595 [Verrucomicrobiota bacterium JB024]|nr:hypothetical protein [Verrucomicrobiota bacterium JB024]
MSDECKLPPAGWRCTRKAGHEGPCAAVPNDRPTVAKNATTETPRTDKWEHEEMCGFEVTWEDNCRQLERELAEATATAKAFEEQCDALTGEVKRLNEALDAWKQACANLEGNVSRPEDVDGWLVSYDDVIACFPEEYRMAGYAQSPLELIGRLVDERDELKQGIANDWTQEPPKREGYYWWWNGCCQCAPVAITIMSGNGRAWVCIKDDPRTREPSVWGGWWKRISEPATPEIECTHCDDAEEESR